MAISFDAWPEGRVAPSRHDVRLVAAQFEPILEPISQRLKGALQHPNRSGVLHRVLYSQDGKRIIASDYPGGVVQLWGTATGRQLTTIDTAYGHRRSWEYFYLTPDWKALLASREKQKITRIEKDGKRMIRWDFDGEIRSWNLASGKRLWALKHNPPRNIFTMNVSPDGSTIVTGEELPGEFEGKPPRAASLWDVRTQQCRPLPDDVNVIGVFTPDSKMVAMTTHDDDGYTTALKLFDTTTAKEKLSIHRPSTNTTLHGFSPDGRILIGTDRTYAVRKDWKNWECSLKLWDTVSGREIFSLPSEERNTDFLGAAFSPNGKFFAASSWRASQARLYVFRRMDMKLLGTLVLGEKDYIREPVFSPDSQLIAAVTQLFPEEVRGSRTIAAEDLPQPRIHLVDVATATVRETIVAPQGITCSSCFSPDSKTLATGGAGKVLLWDLTKPPIAAADSD